MNAALKVGAGVVAGAAATYGLARLLTNEHVPSQVSPIASGVTLGTAAGAGSVLLKGNPALLAMSFAAGATVAGAGLFMFPRPLWNTHGGLMAGTYGPERLIIQNEKAHLEGTVNRVSFPGDGDVHIVVTPDPGYEWMKYGRAHGVITEPVPDDQGRIPLPHVGDKVAVDGPLVWDSTHGWSEIHPVKDLRITQADGPRPPRPVADAQAEAAKDPAQQSADQKQAVAEEKAREHKLFIGGGLALGGAALLGLGLWRGIKYHQVADGVRGLEAIGQAGKLWRQSAFLNTAGMGALIAGGFIGGQSRD